MGYRLCNQHLIGYFIQIKEVEVTSEEDLELMVHAMIGLEKIAKQELDND
jgi:hypothetical protein